MILHIDIETYSCEDIKKTGLYKYIQSPSFEVLLFAYAYDNNPIDVIDLAQGEKIPESVLRDLQDPKIIKMAHNAAFEWYALSKYTGTALPIEQWQCTMVHALYCGYPASLDAASKAMGLGEDKQKIAAGKALIRKFCSPCKPTKSNGERTRNLPKHEPEQWELFKEYCKQDVEVERAIESELSAHQMPQSEWENWHLDIKINATGVLVDRELIQCALQINAQVAEELRAKGSAITGLTNPNSVAQLKTWMRGQGVEVDSLDKSAIADLIDQCSKPKVLEMLKVRQESAKSSTKKYDAMQNAVCDDGRIRGLLQFYGAGRTGRWAGRLVQVQNLPRNRISTLDTARKLVKQNNIDMLRLLYGNIPDVLSQLIRTAFIPAEDHRYIIADYSAIEARVIAWLAGEEWVLDVFRGHGKIYEATASQMFGVPIERIKKGSPDYELRQKGKVATLALGYQGSTGALTQMGALKMGLTEGELPDIVTRWRAANPNIVRLWHETEKAAITCVQQGTPLLVTQQGIVITRDEKYMMIRLPSGRSLYYNAPQITAEGNRPRLSYAAVNQSTRKFERTPTYGGKLVENITQAVARDCLAYAMRNLWAAGYRIVMHIHDEVVLEAPKDSPDFGLDKAIRIMCTNPIWATDLPLNADGFETMYYKKE